MRPRDPIARRAARGGATRRRISVAAWVTLAGCGVGQVSDDTGSPAEIAHARFTDRAWPALARCVGCHGRQPAIDFLAPGDPDGAYATIFDFQPPVVDIGSPPSSLLVTMGAHTGPALTPDESAALLAWLTAERIARVPATGDPVHVGPLAVQLGAANAFDLGVAGAVVRFGAVELDGGLYLSDLEIVAGTAALHVVHPLFASQPRYADPVPDAEDLFAGIDADLPAGTALPLGGGTAVFWAFAPSDPLSINFTTLEAP